MRDSADDAPATGRWWGGPGHLVDFTSARAREVWRRRLSESVLAHGTTSVWNDNCEYDSLVDLDARCDFDGAGGTVGRLKSVMANLMCQVTRQVVEDWDADARPFVVCRSGHAGIQRYAQTWSGDNSTSWESLEHNVATMLGMSLSGVAHQGTDIGGFHGPAPTAELFVRWVQHGVFQPRFSIHSANTDNTVTEPWMYSGRTDLVRQSVQLRYRLFPYLYSLAARAHRTGLPLVEPMCSVFQHDPATYDESVDMMLGDALLVASVVRPGTTRRRVYLPEGEQFFDLGTRRGYDGGKTVEIDVDQTSIPVLLRAGGIVPMAGQQIGNLSTEPVTALRIVCAPQRDGEFVLYEDDGHSRAFERGEWLQTRITMRAGRRVEIGFTRTGSYTSSVEHLTLDLVCPEGAASWVTVEGETIPRMLDREVFDRADLGWYYSATLRSLLLSYPNPHRDHLVTVSFEALDLIGM
ncbi:TIM-barrel domain-containing protein [Ornithinimicrobium panacihumi]|uniref:glycoside hydrolase family 31 protein n=1 Tax=Ornithinimicrobium panacihumi TaxID=2008449 RepID=UPI003F8B96D5